MLKKRHDHGGCTIVCKGFKGYELEDEVAQNVQEKFGVARFSARDGAVRKGLHRDGAARNRLYVI